MEHYALEKSVNYHRLFNEPEANQLDEIRIAYHRGLIELYGKDYFNDPHYKLKNVMHQKFSALQTNLTSFKGKGKNPFVADMTIEQQSKKMEDAKKLTLILNAYKSDMPVPVDDLLNNIQVILKFGILGKNVTTPFLNEEFSILEKKVYEFDRFTPLIIPRLADDWRKTFGKMSFVLHVPYEQHDSKYINKTRPCVQAKELPSFYTMKGKIGL